VADARAVSPLARLIHALQQEGIRFQIAGMSAAILQGVPATTLDTSVVRRSPDLVHFPTAGLPLHTGQGDLTVRYSGAVRRPATAMFWDRLLGDRVHDGRCGSPQSGRVRQEKLGTSGRVRDPVG
jgi:hypothetical protein